MFVIGTILASIIGYFVGSFSFSITVVKIKTKKDIRQEGSKNAGATNASRILGKAWGVVIVFLDAFKILFTAIIAMLFSYIPSPAFNETSFFVASFFAVLGHCFPIYYKFKGGKAVSCFFGLMMVTNWAILLVFFGLWWLILLTTKKVSIASIFSSIISMILLWVPQITGGSSFIINGIEFFTPIYDNGNHLCWFNYLYVWNKHSYFESFLTMNIVVTMSTIVLILRHVPNIKRLIKGVEPAYLKSKKDKKEQTLSNEKK
ncbi:glycerol-3-phosphate 1-O-acyltransferase PlsY [Spiroplasma apis]|uniref:Glycerol-3-phosphate acyltransferase n=1 Tax=Spiroplasma apis B31 TaxID=1276258 RepID=V5RIV4_SPIAP|nr:glycerol-3-phosphate 1-O-acyltransferase PlsY [Spiroplasma apis]AHB36418.1 glycerol-3-phosphate acyltransferase PlsY [Spiroplasma apis B31]